MRLSRIIMALTVGLAVVAVPTVAGAAQPQPARLANAPQPDSTQPPKYPPGLATLTVSPTTIKLGETVHLRGSGWKPGESVLICAEVTRLHAAAPDQSRRGSGETVAFAPVSFHQAADESEKCFKVKAKADGTFKVPFTPKRTGTYTFTAVGQESKQRATAVLKVLPDKQPHPPLPVTGSSLSTPLKIGGGLLGAGAVMVLMTLAWRRRHSFGGGSAH